MIIGNAGIKYMVETFGLIDPFDYDLLQPASVDVRLGDQFKTQFDMGPQQKQKQYLSRYDVIQVCTLETFKMPINLAAEMKLKSSWSRKGINLANGCWVDPGFVGQLTITLTNYTQDPITMHYCMPFAQMIFYEVKDCSMAYSGKYQNSKGLQEARE